MERRTYQDEKSGKKFEIVIYDDESFVLDNRRFSIIKMTGRLDENLETTQAELIVQELHHTPIEYMGHWEKVEEFFGGTYVRGEGYSFEYQIAEDDSISVIDRAVKYDAVAPLLIAHAL